MRRPTKAQQAAIDAMAAHAMGGASAEDGKGPIWRFPRRTLLACHARGWSWERRPGVWYLTLTGANAGRVAPRRWKEITAQRSQLDVREGERA